MQPEAVTGGPRAVPSALATSFTASFDLPLTGTFLMYEAGGGAIRQRDLWKASFQTPSSTMGLSVLGRAGRAAPGNCLLLRRLPLKAGQAKQCSGCLRPKEQAL